MGHTLPFDTIEELRADMGDDVPALATEGLKAFEWNPPALDDKGEGRIEGYPIKDFYLTNAICRASPTMQRCSARSEEHTSELQSLMRISYAVFCLKKKNTPHKQYNNKDETKLDTTVMHST